MTDKVHLTKQSSRPIIENDFGDDRSRKNPILPKGKDRISCDVTDNLCSRPGRVPWNR